eukprot:Tbor_TRINITY_DN2889_c0_g2::TRINITY_DN2889_c0_g2_i1::g.23125::m.23125/K03595/era, ERAL1; GTPase
MIRKCTIIFQKTMTGTASRHRSWEERVGALLETDKRRKAEAIANRHQRKYGDRNFTPVEQVFPIAEATGQYAEAHLRQSPQDAHKIKASLLGPPNVGKSSLVNALVHKVVSAEGPSSGVTSKVMKANTTVHSTQLVFLDTPGIVDPGRIGSSKPSNLKNGSIEAFDSLMGVDCVLACIPVNKMGFLDIDHKKILKKIAVRAMQRELPIDLVMTKCDLIQNSRQESMYFSFRSDVESLGIPFRKTFETSVLHSKGLIELKDHLCMVAKPVKVWEPSSIAEPLIVVDEIIRQSFFENLPHVVPYSIKHEVVGWTKQKDGSLEVFVEVFSDKATYMSIFLSKLGQIVKSCGKGASRELEKRVRFVFQVIGTPGGVKS